MRVCVPVTSTGKVYYLSPKSHNNVFFSEISAIFQGDAINNIAG